VTILRAMRPWERMGYEALARELGRERTQAILCYVQSKGLSPHRAVALLLAEMMYARDRMRAEAVLMVREYRASSIRARLDTQDPQIVDILESDRERFRYCPRRSENRKRRERERRRKRGPLYYPIDDEVSE
jgi:hypothetical protein